MRTFISTILISLFAYTAFAQQEAPDLRRGNHQYADSNYVDAEVNYRRALDKNSQSFQANFNLGDALYRQEKYPEALEAFGKAEQALNASDKPSPAAKSRLASTYHNIGNALYAQQQYDKAVAAYQQSLRLNPKDNDTRYNLVKAMQQLQQQQNQPNQQQQEQQQQEQQQEQQQQEQQQQQNQQQQQQNQMDKETAEQILQALEQDEQETQEKLQRQQGQKRRVEKEW